MSNTVLYRKSTPAAQIANFKGEIYTTFDQAKVRKQLCVLCGLYEAAVWENRGGQGGARAQRGAGGWIWQN